MSEVDFTGINTALASAKAGKQPTFGASESATINPSDRISSVNHFNEYWIDIKDTTKSISSSEDEKSSTFTFEAGHSYCYYVVRDFRATKNKEDEYVLKAAYDLKGDNTAGYLRTLKSSEITIKADEISLSLASDFTGEDSILNPPKTLTGFALVGLPNDPDNQYQYQDYDPDATLSVGYYQLVTVPEPVPSATVTDIDVKGTVGTSIDPVEFTTNATDMKFVPASDMAKWAAVDGNSFDNCINLPKGLELSYVDSDNTFATFKISGTPTEAVSKSFEITIPFELTDGKNDITVTANTNAKWDIADVKKEEPTPTPAPAETEEPNYVYRLYNSNSGEHFYTTSTYERDYIMTAGWDYEGKAWVAPESGTPVIRMYNPVAGEHHYTTSQEEAAELVEAGWDLESDCAFYSADAETGMPIYRLYNPNAFANNHHFTPSEDEVSFLEDAGWIFEGTAFYGVK